MVSVMICVIMYFTHNYYYYDHHNIYHSICVCVGNELLQLYPSMSCETQYFPFLASSLLWVVDSELGLPPCAIAAIPRCYVSFSPCIPLIFFYTRREDVSRLLRHNDAYMLCHFILWIFLWDKKPTQFR